ncbi:hypothetical protein NDU88_003276 [Pleurodeles waltl]|uniref:Uncharacterized protein n=1 Tax=Pleurodeles waltl TaxID=8319 RepID=A0AAV7RI33_PLEWA|nr:hypothetical protein NDU88_003276 [Pleurodeles waltl]
MLQRAVSPHRVHHAPSSSPSVHTPLRKLQIFFDSALQVRPVLCSHCHGPQLPITSIAQSYLADKAVAKQELKLNNDPQEDRV